MTKTEQIQKIKDEINARKKKAIKVLSPQKKIIMKLLSKRAKWSKKERQDKLSIIELIKIVSEKDGLTLKTISNKFDSPNIISSVLELYTIEEVFISTWALTDIGLLRLKTLSDTGIKVTVLLDKVHSYKWTFESGAYKAIGDVNFVFTQNHSKFMCFKLKDERPLNFIGSFNLSNNPRYENAEINRSQIEYDFYINFVKSCENGDFQEQYTLF